MAYTAINKYTDHFNTKLYTGTGATGQGQTGVGFQPDLTWIKCRSNTHNHMLTDAVRGTTKQILSNTTGAETSWTNGLTSFDSDGFTVAGSDEGGASSKTYAAWNWKANGAGSSNTDGTINSTVSANTTAGFSIVKYTGNGGSTAKTVGHGLGVAPKVVIIKPTSLAYDFMVYHEGVGATKGMCLNTNQAEFTSSNFNDTAPTTSVFSVKNNATNETGGTYIAYCFAEKVGYSKFGKYIGNGNADGTFVYTGFKPAFLMIKRTNSTEHWHMYDIKRNTYYPTSSSYGGMATRLMANLTASTDLSQGGFEFLSNGLKMTTSWAGGNGSGDTFIYMCFGQSLVGSNDIPCTAR